MIRDSRTTVRVPFPMNRSHCMPIRAARRSGLPEFPFGVWVLDTPPSGNDADDGPQWCGPRMVLIMAFWLGVGEISATCAICAWKPCIMKFG